jgi:hypothetical protein
MLTLRIKDNLHIVGDSIISYNTEVAIIEKSSIIRLGGTWSQNTGRHITLIAGMLKRPIIGNSKKKESYDKLPYGVKFRLDGAIGFAGSLKILQGRALGLSHMSSCVYAWPELSKRDRGLVEAEYRSVWSEFERQLTAAELGIFSPEESPDLSKINI